MPPEGIPGLISHASNTRYPSQKAKRVDWSSNPWIDRRVFTSEVGEAYEPGLTRGGLREAHVVMTKGCDWSCSFCTEGHLSRHEVRRDSKDVLGEVYWLIESGVQRVQFIDDNVLPQIAARPDEAVQSRGMAWKDEFLRGLANLAQSESFFGWRGIMRLEDYLAYRQASPSGGFARELADSGCNLIAFGIESGNHSRRQNLKGGATPSNDVITSVVKELAEVGVSTKGYFMIGGPDETVDSALETVDFAVAAGFDLAYFALYKDFASMPSIALDDTNYYDFNLFQTDLSDFLSLTDTEINTRLPIRLDSRELEEARESMKTLEANEFNFADLFKYNDYHLISEHKSKVWSDQASKYFSLVNYAYIKFYARNKFAQDYVRLLENGY